MLTFSNKVEHLIHKRHFTDAERDNDDSSSTVISKADMRRKEKRNQMRDMNRNYTNEIYSSPEYDILLNNSIDDRWDDDGDHELTIRHAMRKTNHHVPSQQTFETRQQRNIGSSEYLHYRRRKLSTEFGLVSSPSFDDAKFHSCASLNSTNDEAFQSIAGTPKRLSRTHKNLFESNMSSIYRISDYRGFNSQEVATPEIQLACAKNATTLPYWNKIIAAFGICFLIWNCIQNMKNWALRFICFIFSSLSFSYLNKYISK